MSIDEERRIEPSRFGRGCCCELMAAPPPGTAEMDQRGPRATTIAGRGDPGKNGSGEAERPAAADKPPA